MPALMFDSDNPSVLLSPACQGCRVLTYADLATPTLIAQGGSRLGWIDRGLGDPLNVATIADIEPGALSVTSAVAKIREWTAQKRQWVTAYHDRNDAAAVTAALAGLPCHRWVATLDGTLRFSSVSPAAVQFAGAVPVGFHADVSVVWDDGWRPLPAGPSQSAVTAVKIEAGSLAGVVKALQAAVSAL